MFTIGQQLKEVIKYSGIEGANDKKVQEEKAISALKAVSYTHLLHARNLANTVGAKGEVLEIIVKQMVREKKVRIEYAQELFDKYTR